MDDVIERAYHVTQMKLSALVTQLLLGETIHPGALMRYAAYVAPKFHSPEIAMRFAKKGK